MGANKNTDPAVRWKSSKAKENLGHQAASGVIIVPNRPSRTAAPT
jgi:hypothetical protein